MIEFSHILYEIVVWIFLLYSAVLFVIYCWIGYYAFGALKRYRYLNQHTDYNLIATHASAPSFSIIAPAYNEGMTIVDNVRSLLSLHYPDLEIIIVNDGSKDDSIDRLIQAYDLEKIPFYYQMNIPTKDVRGIYKSKNKAFARLVVVDKVNGGKSDALNVGVNISSGKYIVCIDVDCILEQDAILKLAKPFLDQTDARLIACGGVIRLANNCQVENGKIVKVSLPKSWLGRFQALEYIRAFVLGRMAWSRASGLILISGAFGAFDKDIVSRCGGYDSKTVGEDMELVVRMRRYMEENKLSYKVENIPDPLCWTEVPESKEILKRQRNRWMRGTIETLWKHRKLMFNSKYRGLGLVSIPYWFFFEFLGPLMEFFGYCVFVLFLFLGIINWAFFFVLLALVLCSGVLYSVYAILVDITSYRVYTRRRDLYVLMLTAILEPFFYHGSVVLAGVAGVRDYFKKQHSWGEMTRQGFQQSAANLPLQDRLKSFFSWGLKDFAPMGVLFMLLYVLSIAVELFWYSIHLGSSIDLKVIAALLYDNLIFGFQIVSLVGILYFLFLLYDVRWAKRMAIVLFTGLFTLQFILFLYFSESKNLLGADVYFYSLQEIKGILKTSGMLTLTNIALLLLVITIGYIPLYLSSKGQHKKVYIGLSIFILGLIATALPWQRMVHIHQKDSLSESAAMSKEKFFLSSNMHHLLQSNEFLNSYVFSHFGPSSSQSEPLAEFAFQREETATDFLGPYFKKTDTVPNLVFIIVEGLGHAYSSPTGYIGNFTPFLDSLKSKSLYWENALSSSGRTFSVLPSLLGSLPFASNGFLEQEIYPEHFNLINVLAENNFSTGFYYGGDASFDFMDKYMAFSKAGQLVDIDDYPEGYKRLPVSSSGESWGYEDQAVMENMLAQTPSSSQPYFNVLMTLSTHSPFLINNAPYYQDMVDKRINELGLSAEKKKTAQSYKLELSSVMNLDDALRGFFNQYSKRGDFQHTIFVITGDHSMPEIFLQSKIDRYHVPLLVYSPLLKGGQSFKNIVSHYDLAPSILAYYRENFQLKTPKMVHWVGRGLDVGASASSSGVAIMQSKYQMEDFVYAGYHLSGANLFKLGTQLQEDLSEQASLKSQVSDKFEHYLKANKQLVTQKKLLADSVFTSFFNR